MSKFADEITPGTKPRPKAIAVRRALRKYLATVVAGAPGDEKVFAANIVAVQTLAAQFDELDAKIFGGDK